MLRLRELREARHINQQKLAMELNITQAAISKYELGLSEPDISMLKNIACYFRVSVDYLIGISDIPFPYSDSSLGAEEINLLNHYRELDDRCKKLLNSYMYGLSGELPPTD